MVTCIRRFVRLATHDSIIGQADEAAAGNQSEINCLSRTALRRCLRETAQDGTGTPPRETAISMFASVLRRRNGQASDGILWSSAGDDGRKGRGRCLRAAVLTGSLGRKTRLRTGWSGLQWRNTAFGRGSEDATTAATDKGAFRGELTGARPSSETTLRGSCRIVDRTAMPERCKAGRDRKDIEAGWRIFGAAPVPVTGQRPHAGRWNAWLRIPCR